MFVLLEVFTILLCFKLFRPTYSLYSFQENAVGELVFANVLFRHGDRTPIDPYPNDPYRNNSLWPVGFGQLTNTGKVQEYEFGQWLRKRYDILLTQEYNPNIVYVQSTDVDRTLMSAASNLAGMFPPKDSQRWNPHLDWQPIPIHTVPEYSDKVLAGKAPCPAYKQEYERVLHSKEIKELNQRFSNLYKILNENTGRNITNVEDILNIYSTLFIEDLYNFTLPAWTKGIFPEPMKEAASYGFTLQTWSHKLARLKTGLLIQEMISHMKHKIEDKPKPVRNVWIYSAHDTTISNVLHTLGVFDLQCPPYTSAVLMELRVDSGGNHQVMLFYRNSSTQDPYLLTLPGCTATCPLDKFITLCEPLIPQDWDQECRATSMFSTADLSNSNLTVIALVISSLLILVLVTSVSWYWQKRRRPTHCQAYGRLFVVNNGNPFSIKPGMIGPQKDPQVPRSSALNLLSGAVI